MPVRSRSPRDTITVSQTSSDAETIINIATSLPRSADEPAYLRPAPPYVRAHISLLAFCIQLPSPSTTTVSSTAPESTPAGSQPPRNPLASTSTSVASTSTAPSPDPSTSRLRITCFWQWDPKGSWAVGSGIGIHIPALLSGLVEHAREHSDKIPLLSSFGRAVSLSSTSFDNGRDTLNLDYSVVYDEADGSSGVDAGSGQAGSNPGRDAASRTLEFAIPASQGWRIQVNVKSLVRDDETEPRWVATLGRRTRPATGSTASKPTRLVLRLSHPSPPDANQLLRISLSIGRDTSTRATRVNGIIQPIVDLEPSLSADANPGKRLSDQLNIRSGRAAETASLSGFSTRTIDTVSSVASSSDDRKGPEGRTGLETTGSGGKMLGDRSEKAERSVLSLIRRNYICTF